jgi:hypothetical protein
MLHTYEPMKVGIIQSGAMGLGHDPQIPFEFAQGRRFSRSGSFGMRCCLRLHQHPGVFADSLDGLQDGLHVIL